MRVTDFTRQVLHARRARRDLKRDGWEEIDERGGRLWELHRGGRIGHIITDVCVGPTGTTLWIKTAEAS